MVGSNETNRLLAARCIVHFIFHIILFYFAEHSILIERTLFLWYIADDADGKKLQLRTFGGIYKRSKEHILQYRK